MEEGRAGEVTQRRAAGDNQRWLIRDRKSTERLLQQSDNLMRAGARTVMFGCTGCALHNSKRGHSHGL